MRLKPSKNVIIALSAVIVLIVAAFGGVFYLQYGEVTKLDKELQAKQAEVEEGKKIVRKREEALAALQDARDRIGFLESGVSSAAYVPTLLQQLEDLARRTNNRVIAVRPQMVVEAPTRLEQRRDPEAQAKAEGKDGKDGKDGEQPKKQPEPYSKLPIQVTLVGKFATTQAFLRDLQHFKKILAVEDMALRPRQGDPNAPERLLDVEMKLIAFIMKEPTTTRPAGSGVGTTTTASAAVTTGAMPGGSQP